MTHTTIAHHSISMIHHAVTIRARAIQSAQHQLELIKRDFKSADPEIQDVRQLHREYRGAKSFLEQLVARQRYDKWSLKLLQRADK